MSDLLREQDARSSVSVLECEGAGARAGAIHFACAGLGTTLAVLTGCAAVAIASVGAMIDALRFTAPRGVGLWALAGGPSAVLALALAWSWSADHLTAAPWMLAFGGVGLLANAASVFAALPCRVREFGAACLRASSWVYLVLIGLGLLGIAASIEVPLAIVVGFAAGILGLGLVTDARRSS